jgi:hypothetical protein
MKYALNLADDGRILSVTYAKYATADAVLVDELPEGNVADYRYVNGEYIYDPIPVGEVVETPTQFDRIEAQVAYTAMITGTLLEV